MRPRPGRCSTTDRNPRRYHVRMDLRVGYNSNGFPGHHLDNVLDILAEIGYRSVAFTLDVHALNPYDADVLDRAAAVRRRLERLDMACVVETGARFLLDPRRKHQPTLLSGDPAARDARLDFLRRSCDVAAELRAPVVSFWSGAADPPAADPAAVDRAWDHLRAGCLDLLRHADRRGVRLAFEPEPGMLVATMSDFEKLSTSVNDTRLGLTLDVGHVHCLADGDPAAHIRRWRDRLFNVHIEDMRRGVHEHLQFGEGEMSFEPILSALVEIGYAGGVHVELSRHGHDAVNAARRAFHFLSPIVNRTQRP